MSIFEQPFSILIVFFVYGLGFFSMGIALTIEAGRSPWLAERRTLRPLAVFGLLHGGHEWFEIFLMQYRWFGAQYPVMVDWFRIVWLVLSFTPLVVFGILELKTFRPLRFLEIYTSVILISLYILVVTRLDNPQPLHADIFARYMLALPGGLLAAWALYLRSKRMSQEGQPGLSLFFGGAAIGFAVYGLTQLFTPKADLLLAGTINTELFLSATRIPVQVLRASAAIFITANLLHIIQGLERERQQQFMMAQKARVEALERVQQELVEREAMRRELLRHIVIAQEDERARIARELHDETAQVLAAFSLNLATLRSTMGRKTAGLPILDQLQNLSRQMSQGIYRLVHDLRPAQLDDLGLVPTLQYLAEQTKRRLGVSVSLEVSGARTRLDSLVETVVFRVAQEALSNVARHSQVKEAQVTLTYTSDTIILKVIDEGVGFDPSAEPVPPHGWGLAGMRERVESVGGKLIVASQPGQGSRIEVEIPLEQNTTPSEPIEIPEEESTYGIQRDPFNVGR